MDYPTLEALEYPAVLKALSGLCATTLGKGLASALTPLEDLDSIVEGYAEYSEIRALTSEEGSLPLGGITDIRPLLTRHSPEGAYFPTVELLLIRSTIDSIVLLKKTHAPANRFPRTAEALASLSDYDELSAELNRIMDDRGGIMDDASWELKRIRGEMRSEKERARAILDSLVKDSADLLQDEITTIRDDRYVLAVKEGRHTEMPGVVHGRSASGATYFIEPIGLVDMNNRLSILARDEGAEEVRILKEASRGVRMRAEELGADLDRAARLDLLQAKARFAGAVGGVVPKLGSGGEVRLAGARHPLLALKEKQGGPRAVPIDVVMEEGTSVLVISGANTGGKTVALKTLGLLTLMTMSAVPVPADPDSRVAAFASVWADIGDRQNIIDNLSTFSAHVKRLDEFLKGVGPNSLVLIDEIGSGTDPSEGSALALATLETLRELGARTVITTHLNILKAHAATDPAYLNASVEFDEESLKPLYRLRYGVPGASLGLSIAESLGMPGPLIERARSYLSGEEGVFLESLRALEAEREEARRTKERLKSLEARRDLAVRRITEERARIIEKVKGRVDKLVDGARAEIDSELERFRGERSAKAASRASSKVSEIGSRVTERATRTRRYVPAKGDRVAIIGTSTRGVVVSVDPALDRAELLVGKMKVWADFKKLVMTGPGPSRPSRASQEEVVNADMEVSSSLNLVGMRVDEAMRLLVKFLDNAHAGGLERVQVVHGVGTGALAAAVADQLSSSLVVKEFYRGDPLAGGGGITIVELK